MQKLLKKEQFKNFLQSLIQNYQVIAPVKKDNTKFDIIQKPKQVYLRNITQVPLKKFFLPDNETLLEFDNQKIIESKDNTPIRIIFGLRLCDINALLVLDKIMQDPKYIMKRRKTIIIGYHCSNPDKYCFCNSMQLIHKGYDLFFYPTRNHYFISIGSKKGLALVKHLPNAKITFNPRIKNIKTLPDKNITNHYQDKAWQTNSDNCLSCSACTIYCPTCNCFDIIDKSDLNNIKGKRTRSEASCQLQSFSRVAGNKIFRNNRASRFKHFVYHKIDYFKKSHGRYMCVGCGRCLRVCPTKIDWTNTINLITSMKSEEK